MKQQSITMYKLNCVILIILSLFEGLINFESICRVKLRGSKSWAEIPQLVEACAFESNFSSTVSFSSESSYGKLTLDLCDKFSNNFYIFIIICLLNDSFGESLLLDLTHLKFASI